jgi:hypothetical protein
MKLTSTGVTIKRRHFRRFVDTKVLLIQPKNKLFFFSIRQVCMTKLQMFSFCQFTNETNRSNAHYTELIQKRNRHFQHSRHQSIIDIAKILIWVFSILPQVCMTKLATVL